MRHLSWIIVAYLTAAPATHHFAYAQDAKPLRHTWSDISYPRLPAAAVGSLVPGLSLRNGKHDGLQLIVWYSFRDDDDTQKKIPPLEKTLVRLHTPDGKVADSKSSDRGVIGNLGINEYSYNYSFAWTRNLLEEAWIE